MLTSLSETLGSEWIAARVQPNVRAISPVRLFNIILFIPMARSRCILLSLAIALAAIFV